MSNATTMNRTELCEYRLVVLCETVTPLHTGSGEASHVTDAELRRNAKGQYIMPGTSIAGALRTIVERISGVAQTGECRLYTRTDDRDDALEPCPCAVCRLFGNVEPGKTANEHSPVKAFASKLTVFDAVFECPRTRVVDGVAINRTRGSAQDSKKFDYRQILPGSKLQIEIRAVNLTTLELDWISAALRIIARGEVGLGGRSARGNGFLKPDETKCFIDSRNVHEPDDVLAYVLEKNDSQKGWGNQVAKQLDQFSGNLLSLPNRIGCDFLMAPAPNSGFLISDPVRTVATGYDAASRRLDQKAEIPGSSLTGVLRSGAERIVRTLGGIACDPVSDRCKKPRCLVCELFGNEDFASRLAVRVSSKEESREMPFDHVAIDRFTGGASDQKKFDALTMMEGEFSVHFTIDRADDPTLANWMIGLLALTLRDLHQGRLWIGKGGSKGNGLFLITSEPCWQMPVEWGMNKIELSNCVLALNDEVRKREKS